MLAFRRWNLFYYNTAPAVVRSTSAASGPSGGYIYHIHLIATSGSSQSVLHLLTGLSLTMGYVAVGGLALCKLCVLLVIGRLLQVRPGCVLLFLGGATSTLATPIGHQSADRALAKLPCHRGLLKQLDSDHRRSVSEHRRFSATAVASL